MCSTKRKRKKKGGGDFKISNFNCASHIILVALVLAAEVHMRHWRVPRTIGMMLVRHARWIKLLIFTFVYLSFVMMIELVL